MFTLIKNKTMRTKTMIITLLLTLGSITLYGQSKLESINNEVWYPFYKAFETLDYQIMASVHSEELSRIPASRGHISTYQEYIEGTKRSFERKKQNGQTAHISLRFFERITSEKRASERGIYRTIHNKNKPDQHVSYGQFFVLLQKENGRWKIVLDYDSDENGTIGEQQYNNAYAIDNLEPFEK
jgi:hypothetical protein